ncbi:hypothetical protein YQE_11538, partial [Dendroctonus ponderosae]
MIAYADDLALVVTEKTVEIVQERAVSAIRRVTETLEDIDIRVAPEKTESVLLIAPRKVTSIVLEAGERSIATSDHVKYLRAAIDRNVKMRTHIRKTAEKANKMITLLYRLRPRVGGPKASKRRTLARTVRSASLFGVLMWHLTLKFKHYSDLIAGINRRLAIMITSAYRTVPTTAVEAIAGMIPFDLLDRWSRYEGWTKVFIKSVSTWSERKFGEVDYYTTQIMTGHGIFGSYLKRIKKQANNCWFCGEQETPEHTLFRRARFEMTRIQAELTCQKLNLNYSEHRGVMVENEACWDAIRGMFTEIMKIKVEEEGDPKYPSVNTRHTCYQQKCDTIRRKQAELITSKDILTSSVHSTLEELV